MEISNKFSRVHDRKKAGNDPALVEIDPEVKSIENLNKRIFGQGRILVVEDEALIRDLFKKRLTALQYEIMEAENGEEGLRRYRENPPDLVITDIVMPDKDGTEFIMALKRDFPAAKIIAMSAGGRNQPNTYLEVARILGARYVFAKPVNWSELVNAIRELMEIRI